MSKKKLIIIIASILVICGLYKGIDRADVRSTPENTTSEFETYNYEELENDGSDFFAYSEYYETSNYSTEELTSNTTTSKLSSTTKETTSVKSTTTTTKSTTTKKTTTTRKTTTHHNSSNSHGRIIYVTPTGKRYHYDSHCNGGTYIESTLDEALARGLTPCQKCVQ